MGAFIRAVHDVLVGPFEIERIDQRLAQPAVLELVAPRVDEPALRAGGRVVGEHLALDAAVADGGEFVTCRPHPRGEFLAEQIVLGGEALEGDLAVAIEFEAHDVEIVEPDAHRQLRPPPVLHPLVFDVAPGFEAPDPIGPRAERNIEIRFVERMARIIGAREDRQAGGEQRHVARAPRRKADHHGGVVGRFHARKILQALVDDGVALLLEDRQREGDVMGGQLGAVVKARLGAHQVAVGLAVGRNAHRARRQPIHAVRLVVRARHQAREGQLHALRGVALEDVAVERIEGEEVLIEHPVRADLREDAAFRGLRIDIVEMGEVARIFEVAEDRDAVAFRLVRRLRRETRRARERAGTDDKRVAAGDLHCRFPVFAARSASHHQIVGKAAAPYSGNLSGWPKRSQRALRTLP